MVTLSPAHVSQSRKAAMVVQLILREGGDLPLSHMPAAVQERLAKELGALDIIDRATLHSVATEFASELAEVALTPYGSIEAALKSLEGRISPETAARLRDEAGGVNRSDPWAMIMALSIEDMVPITTAESPEIASILLSKLPTAKAASLLGLLSGESARRIAYAMSKTATIRPETINRIGLGLAQQYCGAAVPAFADTAQSRIGAILNSSLAATRDGVLEGLADEDPKFAEEVRKAIFTFTDITDRLAIPDVPKVLRALDQAELCRALASASAAGGGLAVAASHILDNLSTRMADSLREEMSEVGKIRPAEAEKAQAAVVTAIRDAADAGTITLIVAQDDEDA